MAGEGSVVERVVERVVEMVAGQANVSVEVAGEGGGEGESAETADRLSGKRELMERK